MLPASMMEETISSTVQSEDAIMEGNESLAPSKRVRNNVSSYWQLCFEKLCNNNVFCGWIPDCREAESTDQFQRRR